MMPKKTTLLVTVQVMFLCCCYKGHAQQPLLFDFEVYYGHLHNHTGYSDGEETPVEAYTHARDVAQLDFLGISEHGIQLNSLSWSSLKDIADTYNVSGEFVTFWGFEWTSSILYGHISVMNTDEYTNVLQRFTFSDLVEWLSVREGVAFFNHPGREDYGLEFEHFEYPPSDQFVGMELWNKGTGFEGYYYTDGYFDDDNGKGFFDEALVRGWKIGAAGAHDHHGTSWGETDRAVGVLAESLTRETLYEAIKARRFFSTEDRSLVMSFQLDGSEMGSTLEGGVEREMHIMAYDQEGEEFGQLALYKNGELFYFWPLAGEEVNTYHQVTGTAYDYYYVKLTQSDGDEAISSPIFIDGNGSNVPPQVTMTGPGTGGIYTAGVDITLEAEAEDIDGNVQKVAFYQGQEKIGEDTTRPYQVTWNGVEEGEYIITAVATDNEGLTNASYAIAITVQSGITLQLSKAITAGEDDAEEGWTGIVYSTSSDLELVYDDWLTGSQKIGLRYKDLEIPNGANVEQAYIQFTCDETTSEATNVTIYGENAPNPSAFSQSQDISSRPLTFNFVQWDIPVWDVSGASDDAQRTPDISTVLQEIVSQPDWKAGNALAFVIKGDGKRVAEAYEGGAAPILTVDYTTSPVSYQAMRQPATMSTVENRDDAHDDLSIYPNPFDHVINVKGEGKMEVKLFDFTGREVQLNIEESSGGYRVHTPTLWRGVYYLEVVMGESSTVRKLIKE